MARGNLDAGQDLRGMLEPVNPFALLEADDCVLLVIDVQDAFLNKLPADEGSSLLAKIVWSTRLAQWRQGVEASGALRSLDRTRPGRHP